MKVTWEVEDGYVGKSRPHYTDIADEDLADCESNEERDELIAEYIQNDFEQNISWSEVGREES